MTYDCACPFVDAIEGIMHALRIWDLVKKQFIIEQVWSWTLREQVWRFEKQLILEHTSLDDPHFPTVQGIIHRGLKVRALKQFILEQVIYH